VRLRGEVVDLVGQHLLDDAREARAVGHVPVVQEELHALLVGIAVQMVDAVVLKSECAASRRAPRSPSSGRNSAGTRRPGRCTPVMSAFFIPAFYLLALYNPSP
jgi:hypothetical protein